MSRSDRLIGIALGLVIGLTVLIVLLFAVGGEVDAPSLDGGGERSSAPAP